MAAPGPHSGPGALQRRPGEPPLTYSPGSARLGYLQRLSLPAPQFGLGNGRAELGARVPPVWRGFEYFFPSPGRRASCQRPAGSRCGGETNKAWQYEYLTEGQAWDERRCERIDVSERSHRRRRRVRTRGQRDAGLNSRSGFAIRRQSLSLQMPTICLRKSCDVDVSHIIPFRKQKSR